MKTLIIIGGGNSYQSHEEYLLWLNTVYPERIEPWIKLKKKWKHTLALKWNMSGWVVYMPEMPNNLNAKYDEWKIVFEAVLKKISPDDEVTLIGHSLWGNFLLKYFSDISVISTIGDILPRERRQDFSQDSKWQMLRILQIHLVAACISEGDFVAPGNYEVLRSLWDRVHIWHAEDDLVVPFATAKILEQALPHAVTHFFTSERLYGHFSSGLEIFPEIEWVCGL